MHDKAFTFQTLRPDTIIDGLFDLGMRVDSGLTPLNSYENRVYQFQDEERHRYVVKFYRPERWSAAQILEEHQFALQLVEDEVPVAAPLLFNDSTLHQHQGFYLMRWSLPPSRYYAEDRL
ncbi:phosphotransferase, partial [Klebsiella quasipneumoniae]